MDAELSDAAPAACAGRALCADVRSHQDVNKVTVCSVGWLLPSRRIVVAIRDRRRRAVIVVDTC